jgi:hypothetical protein
LIRIVRSQSISLGRGSGRALGAIEATAHRLHRFLADAPLHLRDDLADDAARRLLRALGDDTAEGEEGSDEVDIGLDRIQ